MKAEDKYYRKLVEGYLNKTLTKRELTVFFDLMSKGELDFYFEEDMVSNFPTKAKDSIFPNFRWISIAATVLIVVGVTFYFLRQGDRDLGTKATVAQLVKPGGEHAILTLSNGEQIILDSSRDVADIEENHVSVVKNNATGLQYDLSKLDLSHVSEEELKGKYHTLETPRGGTYQIVLPDGSKVWLNSLSKIRFPLLFDPYARRVEMEGEVYFEIAHNKKQPFYVRSKGQEIKVLGTAFNVNAYEDEPFIRTTLVTGRIELKNEKASIRLNPKEEVLNTGGSLKIQMADIDQVMAWKDGYFRFDKVDIQTLMRQMSRWYNINVRYIGQVSNERFVGKIKRSEDINELIKIFNHGGMNVSLTGRTIVVQN